MTEISVQFHRHGHREYAFASGTQVLTAPNPREALRTLSEAVTPVCEGCVFKRAGVCNPALMTYAAWYLGESGPDPKNGPPVLFNNTYHTEIGDIKAYEPLPDRCPLSPFPDRPLS